MYFGEGQGSYKITLLLKLGIVLRHIIKGIIYHCFSAYCQPFSLVCKSIHVDFFLCLATLTQIFGLKKKKKRESNWLKPFLPDFHFELQYIVYKTNAVC